MKTCARGRRPAIRRSSPTGREMSRGSRGISALTKHSAGPTRRDVRAQPTDERIDGIDLTGLTRCPSGLPPVHYYLITISSNRPTLPLLTSLQITSCEVKRRADLRSYSMFQTCPTHDSLKTRTVISDEKRAAACNGRKLLGTCI